MSGRGAVWVVALVLAGCGGASAPQAPQDETLRRDTQAARLAFRQERPEDAIVQYRSALRRAGVRDDLTAIGDLGYNLAVAELAANRPQDALATVRTIRAELRRRGGAQPADLDLVEATALFRTGAIEAADRHAAAAQAAGGATGARASLLRGIIADQRNDIAGLRAAFAALETASTAEARADRDELAARLGLRDGDPVAARAVAERAADLRRAVMDYRGLARALALAGDAARAAGQAEDAADLYLRAGRSAAAQGDPDHARLWLQQAMTLTASPSLRAAVEAQVRGVDAPP